MLFKGEADNPPERERDDGKVASDVSTDDRAIRLAHAPRSHDRLYGGLRYCVFFLKGSRKNTVVIRSMSINYPLCGVGVAVVVVVGSLVDHTS